MQVSEKGVKFISGHEGNPLTCYLDPVGIPTIGHGFTMRSSTARRELAKLGIKKLVPGKTKLTAKQSDNIFMILLNGNEYAGAVMRGVPKGRAVKQHMFDAMLSAVFNLGGGFMKWRWKTPWATKNDIAASAAYWSRNYNKAAGRRLAGLVRRRKEEAKMFEKGVYTGVKGDGIARKAEKEKPRLPDPTVKEAQEILIKLGIHKFKADGWYGPRTRDSIIAYQEKHPHLVNDGILGKATITQLRREQIATNDTLTKGGGSIVAVGTGAVASGLSWWWVAGAVAITALAVGGYFAWKYRDVIQRKLNARI